MTYYHPAKARHALARLFGVSFQALKIGRDDQFIRLDNARIVEGQGNVRELIEIALDIYDNDTTLPYGYLADDYGVPYAQRDYSWLDTIVREYRARRNDLRA
jgi:hypothetical protein